MAVQIQYRRGEASEWTAANPTLALGEPGYETDTGKLKIGTGSLPWNDLVYTAANSLLSGEGPPNPVTDGKLGDFYIDITANSIYGPKTELGWGGEVPFIVSTITGLLDVDTITDPPAEGEALIWDPTGGDGTGAWVPGPAGAEASGSAGQIQYNDGASPVPGLAASSDLAWDNTAKELSIGGDINLDDGGTFATTLQIITATANRTISFPDATGTIALIAGSSGQLIYNNAGAQAGLTSASIGSTGEINISLAGAESTPPVSFTGSWWTGGTATTTKPQLLIEPTGTTSTAWNTNGTGIGVNAASGFAGNLLDLQVNGSSQFKVTGSSTYFPTSSTIFQDHTSTNGIVIGNYAGRGIYLGSATILAWNTSSPTSTRDLILLRDAANTLAQRNGTNAQAYRLYNTYTDASNYERGFLKWNSNVFEIGSEGAGTGSEQPVRITAATLKLPNLPTYADNAAATTGGLVAGDVYKTATGELRITV